MKKVLALALLASLLFSTFSALSSSRAGNTLTSLPPYRSLSPSFEPSNVEWNKTFGAEWYDSGHSVLQASDGGFITAGSKQSWKSGYGTVSDFWLVKTDSFGNLMWDKVFDMSPAYNWAASIKKTNDERYIISGTSGYQIWLLKVDMNGNLEWSKTYDIGNAYAGGVNSVQQTSDGGYIVVGSTQETIYPQSPLNALVIKTDTQGNMQWNKIYAGKGHSGAHAVVQTKEGEYVIAGNTWPSEAASVDFWLFKIDVEGNMLWNKTFGGSEWDGVSSLKKTNDDGFILAGSTRSFGQGKSDFWLVKTDLNGNLQWSKTYGGDDWDEAGSLDITSDSGYIIVGKGYGRGLLIKTDSDGNTVWEQLLGGYGEDVKQSSDGGYIITGSSNEDLWLMKLSGAPSPTYYLLHVQSSPITGVSISYAGDFSGSEITNFDIGPKTLPFTVTLTAPSTFQNHKFGYWQLDGTNMGESSSLTVKVDDTNRIRTVIAVYISEALQPTMGLNLIRNPNFEGGFAYWSLSVEKAIYTWNPDRPHSGSFCASGVGKGRLYQDVTDRVVFNEQYKISGWIRTQNAIGKAIIALHYVDSSGQTTGNGHVQEIGYVNGTVEWTYFESAEFLLPPKPDSAVGLWFVIDLIEGSGVAYWDDVALNEIVVIPPDLAILDAEPVQTVYGASAIIAEKLIAIRVNVRNSLSVDKTTKVKIVFGNRILYEDLTIPAFKTSTFHLPLNAKIFLSSGSYSYLVEIDPENSIIESDENNNIKSGNVVVKDSKNLRILYVPIAYPWDAPISVQDVLNFSDKSNHLLLATYPIRSVESSVSTIPFYPPFYLPYLHKLNVAYILLQLSEMAWVGGYDRVIGVVSKGWFMKYGLDIGGVATKFAPGVLVELDSPIGVAHEIGHTYGLDDEYDKAPYPMSTGDWANGFWVSERKFLETYCLMGKGEDFDRWIEKEDYEHLLSKFKTDPSDPEILAITGLIFRNGTVKLGNWYRFSSGEPDIVQGGTGNYSIISINADGQTLSQINFNVSFEILSDPPLDSEVVPFAFQIPYSVGTRLIQVKKNGELVAHKDVSLNAPIVKVISPNGGEVIESALNFTIRWEASDEDGDALSYSVWYSPDNGENWFPLAFNLNESRYVLYTKYLPLGSDYLIKVVANDGVNIGQDCSDSTFTIGTRITPFWTDLWFLVTVTGVAMMVSVIIVLMRKRKISSKSS